MTLPIPHARVFTTEKQKVSNQLQNKVVVNLSREATNEEIKVSYPPEEQEANPYEGVTVVPREAVKETSNETFYRTLLEAYMDNPLFVNQLIVMKTDKLANLIKTMTEADEVNIEIGTDISCCGKTTPYNIIQSIVIIKNGIRNDFEITYNQAYRKLVDYRVSLKFTTD